VAGSEGRRAERRRDQDPVGHGAYGPGALDEVTEPPTDAGTEARLRDIDDVADVTVDPDALLNGGPTRSEGKQTAARDPLSMPRERAGQPQRGQGKIAPTTTGDATSGGMHERADTSTSDNASGQNSGGQKRERR
jgi:hypothetical protein